MGVLNGIFAILFTIYGWGAAEWVKGDFSAHSQYTMGYTLAGGRGDTDAMIRCESTWNVNAQNGHLGLAQFTQDTWELVRRTPDADWRSPFEQGWAVARNIQREDTHPSKEWPNCW